MKLDKKQSKENKLGIALTSSYLLTSCLFETYAKESIRKIRDDAIVCTFSVLSIPSVLLQNSKPSSLDNKIKENKEKRILKILNRKGR